MKMFRKILAAHKGRPNFVPNPFMAGEDLRQGGPLYYSKYFVDRDRSLDEKLFQKEVERNVKSFQAESSTNASKDSSARATNRKRPVWSTYRPLSLLELQRIDSLPKLSRILANEVHKFRGSLDSLDTKSRFEQLEDRLCHLVEGNAPTRSASGMLSRKDLESVVKCLHQFGVIQEISPRTLGCVLESLRTREARNQLKPEQLIYVLQSLSRLRFRDNRLLDIVDSLSLCWSIVGSRSPLMLVRGANAVARLDMCKPSSKSMPGLRLALNDLLPKLTGPQLEKVKAVTVCELFDEHMVLDYLVLCQQLNVQYSRHAVMVYLKFMRKKEFFSKKLPEITKDWFNEKLLISNSVSVPENSPPTYSSPLHEDICRVVGSELQFTQSQTCGPFLFDLFVPGSNTVIEACPEYQFYRRTTKLTTEALLRHELIRSLGFQVVPVLHFNWSKLGPDNEKFKWVQAQIPR